MNVLPRIFLQAKAHSKQSTHSDYHLGAAIFNKRKFVIGGFNSLKSHPSSNPKTIHAELHAIIRAYAIGFDLRNSTLIVYREHKNGHPAMARPCPMCWSAAVAGGIRRVVYTTNEGWQEERL